MTVFKNYLTWEDKRNFDGREVFKRFLHRAVGKCEVVVGHHIVFIVGDDEPNEIPSADALWFDHAIMKDVFGEKATSIMQILAHRAPELREKVLNDYLDALELEDGDAVTHQALPPASRIPATAELPATPFA